MKAPPMADLQHRPFGDSPTELRTPASTLRNVVTLGPIIQYTEPGVPARAVILIYGAPKAGKTTFAGTFPKPLFIEAQGGLMSIREKKVAFYSPSNYTDLISAVVPAVLSKFETVVLDQATEISRIIMTSSLGTSGRDVPQIQDWQMTIERLRKLFRALIDNTKGSAGHVVVVCEEQLVKDESLGRIMFLPNLPGKLSTEAGALFDCVFHLRSCLNPLTHSTGRWLVSEPDSMHPGVGQRLSRSIPSYEVPDFPTLWAKASR